MNQLATHINTVQDLAALMAAMPQQEAPVKHHFSDGVYVREIFMPEGMLIVGKIHKTKHLNIIQQGACRVVTPTRILDIKAPYTFESEAGEQKVVFMYTDVVWSTVHVTEETDLEKIEEHCIAEEYNEELLSNLIRRLS